MQRYLNNSNENKGKIAFVIIFVIIIISIIFNGVDNYYTCKNIINKCMFICYGKYNYYNYTCYMNYTYTLNSLCSEPCITRCAHFKKL
jgi:hypothetical protein